MSANISNIFISPDNESDNVVTRDLILDDAWSLLDALTENPDTLKDIENTLGKVGSVALSERISDLGKYVTTTNRDDNINRLEAVFDNIADAYLNSNDEKGDQGSDGSFNAFRAFVEAEIAGIVMTAHPTFSLSPEAWSRASVLIAQQLDSGKREKPSVSDGDQPIELLPHSSPSLEDELAYANAAIKSARLGLRDMWRACLNVAAKRFPDQWHKLSPTLATIASWVGFDLDGRTDIGWSQSLHFRYYTTLQGLEELREFWSRIADHDACKSESAAGGVSGALDELHATFSFGLETLRKADAENHYAAFNRVAVERRALKDQLRQKVADGVSALISSNIPQDLKQEIATFRAEWTTIGLGLSHIHFRLNAAQLHNAIRPLINLQQAPDRSASRRYYLDAVAALLDDVKTETIHYGTLAEEMTTAKRVFMLAAQFRKHFDDNGSLRMLVAESDTPFTLLVALYYAKLFGVDDYVEISPLFETAIGLQRGDRVIEELLDNPHFAAYIEKQGRFCVQLGFSDSGRYIGQIAASLAIERFKLRLVRLWNKRGLSHIKLVFFDTHGESIGRGAHPASMQDRFNYTHTPEVRRALNAIGNVYKHEVSFQGGDGYLWYLHDDMSLAIITDLLTKRIEKPSSEPDALYANSDWSLDFFLTLTETQERLTEDIGYVRLIDSIGQAMLYPTGSRATKRQGRGKTGNMLETVSQIRAIPNNAVLQQLGFMANTITGIGLAASRNPRRFSEIAAQSPRLQSLIQMALAAMRVSNIAIMSAYMSALSPSYWLDRCEDETPSKKRSFMLRLSRSLEGVFDGNAMRATLRKLRRDGFLLEDMLQSTSFGGNTAPPLDMTVLKLHTLRLALIHFIHLKSMEVPQFSTRQDISLHELINSLLHLNVDETIKELRQIFPAHTHVHDDAPYGEDASYEIADTGGYPREHKEIFDTIEQAQRVILKISSILATKIKAVG